MKKVKDENGKGCVPLTVKEQSCMAGGRLWPYFDIGRLFSDIVYGEDLVFINLFKFE